MAYFVNLATAQTWVTLLARLPFPKNQVWARTEFGGTFSHDKHNIWKDLA